VSPGGHKVAAQIGNLLVLIPEAMDTVEHQAHALMLLATPIRVGDYAGQRMYRQLDSSRRMDPS
jgi:hypothetical protein